MNGRSAGGLVLLLLGSLGLIGFLTGNLDRWLGFLFSPTATPTTAHASSYVPPASSSPATAAPAGGTARVT